MTPRSERPSPFSAKRDTHREDKNSDRTRLRLDREVWLRLGSQRSREKILTKIKERETESNSFSSRSLILSIENPDGLLRFELMLNLHDSVTIWENLPLHPLDRRDLSISCFDVQSSSLIYDRGDRAERDEMERDPSRGYARTQPDRREI